MCGAYLNLITSYLNEQIVFYANMNIIITSQTTEFVHFKFQTFLYLNDLENNNDIRKDIGRYFIIESKSCKDF